MIFELERDQHSVEGAHLKFIVENLGSNSHMFCNRRAI